MFVFLTSISHFNIHISIGKQSPIGQVIYMLKIQIPEEFPKQPPIVRFQQPKVVMDCVNESGYVSQSPSYDFDLSLTKTFFF